MLEFIECWDKQGTLFYTIFNRDREIGELWKCSQWVLLSSDHATYFKCSQKELKQILDKLIELNGEEN